MPEKGLFVDEGGPWERADDDIPPTGGFRASQRRTLLRLAWACVKNNIPEVQRLAAMTLTWETQSEGPTCAEIVDDCPCGRVATRYNAESKVPFCEEHGGQNPRYGT